MIYTADMIGKRDADCIDGRKWYLRHLVDRYGSGNCVSALRQFKRVSKARYPRRLYTENWCSFCWSDMPQTTYDEIADVLNESVRFQDAEAIVVTIFSDMICAVFEDSPTSNMV